MGHLPKNFEKVTYDVYPAARKGRRRSNAFHIATYCVVKLRARVTMILIKHCCCIIFLFVIRLYVTLTLFHMHSWKFRGMLITHGLLQLWSGSL